MSRLRARLRPRRDDDAGIGLLQVVLVMLVAAMLSTAVLGSVVGQLLPTSSERARVRSIAAANAGVEAGLAVLRSATTTVQGVGVVGDLTRLPCATAQAPLRFAGGAPLTSDLTSVTVYTVVVRYFADDPTGQPESWRTANALACSPGTGPAQSPAFALVQSGAVTPQDGRLPSDWADRSVEAVYAFSRTDAATAGGVVKVGSYAVAADLCWASPSMAPAVGTVPTLQPCSSSDPLQQWAFRDDYSIVLGGTQSALTGVYDGSCLTAEPRTRADLTDHGLGAATLTPSAGDVVTTDVLGPLSGSARAFSGSSSWLASSASTVPAAATTVSAWFRTTSRSGTVLGFGADAGTAGTTADRLLWVDSAGHLVWGVSPSSKHTVTSPGAYADGTWHHVAASVGASGTRLYVDGAPVASDLWTAAGTTSGYWHVGWGGELAAGWAQAPANPFWQGSLAHVATFDRQLTDAEVSALATTASWEAASGTTTSLVPHSYWPLGGSWQDLAPFLATCDGLPHQKWSYDDGARLELERFDATRLSGNCVTATALSPGAALAVVPDCGAARDWAPSAAVGAGAAGDVTGQLVNFGEYGRCLDVTNQRVDWPYLIDFPCKADPTHPVLWNQRWTYDPATAHVVTPSPLGDRCLRTPASTGGYVVVVPCSTTDTLQRWTRNDATGSRLTSYTFVDSAGRCLSLGTPGAATGGLAQWSTVVAATCDGSRIQKWNAPPTLAGATVEGYRETTLG